MPLSIVAVNAGSSSVKFAVFEDRDELPLLMSGGIDGIGARPELTVRGPTGQAKAAPPLPPGLGDHAGLTGYLLDNIVAPALGRLGGVGHRVVHGGTGYSGPIPVTDDVFAALERLVPLARSHQPHNLAGVRAAKAVWPDAPHIACFDTAFHRTLPEVEAIYPIPRDITDRGVRRYGFHGLSYEAVARQLPEHLGDQAGEPVVIAHLGNGASLCGMVGLRSQATSMGFTPLDGLVMGRRPGRLDPGIILYCLSELGMTAEEVSDMLNRRCGLFGLSGGRSDMRDLLAADDPAAKLAVEMFVRRLAAEITATATAIGGLFALVFTGGIGENSAEIRLRTVELLGWLGARIDPRRHESGCPDIGAADSAVRLLVIRTDEERVIARAVAAHLRGAA